MSAEAMPYPAFIVKPLHFVSQAVVSKSVATPSKNLPMTNLVMTNLAVVRSVASKRRSNRMSLSAPVGLTGEDRKKSSFTVPARATNLNRHGAAVQVERELSVGTTVVLKNKCGDQLSARVVSHLKEVEGQRTYGIEFVDQDERAKSFWGISFPTN